MSYKFNSGSLSVLGSTTTLNDIFSWSTSETILNSRRGVLYIYMYVYITEAR